MQHDLAPWARRVGLGSGLVVFPHRNCFGWRLLRHRVRCVGILGGHPDGLRQPEAACGGPVARLRQGLSPA